MTRRLPPEIEALRKQLAAELTRALGPGSQHCVAPSFGIAQPRMSELSRGKVGHCSVEWLVERIYRLGGSVRLEVTVCRVEDAFLREHFAQRRAARAAQRAAVAEGTGRALSTNLE